ncbi:MAG: IclR family transcriptional regulator [Anaerolineales bacterium]|nr:IclR family transcriptional regulator [Anaerolineales bacterium]
MENKITRYNIRVIDRTINVLKLLSDGIPRTLTAISREISISSSTVFRILATLSSYNFIQKDDNTDEYKLGLACLELASTYLDSVDIRQQARPELKKLRDLTSETVHLAILDQMEVVYLDKFHTLHAIGMMSSHVGGRAPAYCTGLGKVMLAYQDQDIVRAYYQENGMIEYTGKTITDVETLMKHLAQIRSQGFSKDDGEHEHDVRCLAVQIYDFSGSVVAAISISGPSERLNSIDQDHKLIGWIQQAGMEISKNMGYSP